MGNSVYEKDPDRISTLINSFLPMLIEGAPMLLSLFESMESGAGTGRPSRKISPAKHKLNFNEIDPQILGALMSLLSRALPELGGLLKGGDENNG